MTTLADFLLARIAEDEANAATWPDDDRPALAPNGHLWVTDHGQPIYGPKRRVLADCESKRRIVERCTAYLDDPAYEDEVGGTGAAEDTLSLLSVPYGDHPDFPPFWKVFGAALLMDDRDRDGS